ncbi:hypothetical protein NEF87_003325 [Candidatus Lokiarchaeum ossiferum]|uniref:Enhanced intracellular survival protein domain-containing protein n=1 Tax=Candidatus Lokiarchaeum ossiferum TaxID=2951803 RepID=A0ABY6HU43_9ARCH|nr:hypothetical protein NEF87_003325 [Candidatus Lokiarchaeum sp. B-35]
MKIQQLDQSFENRFAGLLKRNFGQDTTSAMYKYFFGMPEYWSNIYGWVDGADLVSIWNQVPIDLMIRKKKVKAYFIEDAITVPNYRNRGLIKQLFLANCHKAKEEKIDFIALTPFKHKYYHDFGFSSAFNRFRLKISLDLLSKTSSSDKYYVKIGNLGEDEQIRTDFYGMLAEFWSNSNYNERMYTNWGSEKYLEFVKDLRVALAYNSTTNHPKGFLIYKLKNRVLNIASFRYTSLGAFDALRNLISSYYDQAASIHCTSLPEDFPIDRFIHSYWNGGDEAIFSYQPSKMLRVVSPKSVFEKFLDIAPQKPLKILLNDSLLPENSGVYTLTEKKTVQFEIEAIHDLEITIHGLAQMITGRFSASDLYLSGEIIFPGNTEVSTLFSEIPEIILELDRLYPKIVTFYPEYD